MPKVTVGFYTACAHCGRRTDVYWGRPNHLCQVCGRPFCKKCGISYVCKSCLAQQPADMQEKLTKKGRSIPVGILVGVLFWLGGPVIMISILLTLGEISGEDLPVWIIIPLFAGIIFFCCYGIKIMYAGHGKMVRMINQVYFNKDTKELNFTGLAKTGGSQQFPANLQPSINPVPSSFNNAQTIMDVPTTPLNTSTPTEFQFCPLCGGQVRANICQRCGSKICPICGHPDPDKSAKFCGSCGKIF